MTLRRALHSRRFSSQASSSPEVWLSRSHSPTFNLTLEDYLFRTRPADAPLCLVYRNSPCVVLGRNQNPWRELDVREMQTLGLQWIRRRSGGGAVYHDLGNSNYSFHVSRSAFLRATHSELVVRALNKPPIALTQPAPSPLAAASLLGTPAGAYVNARNDICVRVRLRGDEQAGQDGAERKVSGSAYKLINARAYHHGTMLLAAQLSTLGSALHPARGEAMQSKGVASVPSPVVNLSTAYPHRAQALTHANFEKALTAEFHAVYGQGTLHLVDEQHDVAKQAAFVKGRAELQSWTWTHGQTPEFTHTLCFDQQHLSFQLRLHVKGSIVQEAHLSELQGPSSHVLAARAAVARLRGMRYDVLACAPQHEGGAAPAMSEEEDVRHSLSEMGYTDEDRGLEADVAYSLAKWFKEAL